MNVDRLSVDQRSAGGQAATQRPVVLHKWHMVRNELLSGNSRRQHATNRPRRSHHTGARQFSATASSTGWMSVGELAMTPKISLVAVCCSNDSFSSWNKPHILDGDDSLIGEGFQQLDLRRGEGTHLGAT